MRIGLMKNGEYVDALVGMAEEVKEGSVVVVAGVERLEVVTEPYLHNYIQKILTDDPLALVAVNRETNTILLGVDVSEQGLAELEGAEEEGDRNA